MFRALVAELMVRDGRARADPAGASPKIFEKSSVLNAGWRRGCPLKRCSEMFAVISKAR